MNKMREAFEKWIMLQPSHKTERLVAFEAGYQAAIADVKAGGADCYRGQEGVVDLAYDAAAPYYPLYKLLEDE